MSLRNTCPYCKQVCAGGMDLVRHFCNSHNLPADEANEIVDDMYGFEEKLLKTFGFLDSGLFLAMVHKLKQTTERRCHKNVIKQRFLDLFNAEISKIFESYLNQENHG